MTSKAIPPGPSSRRRASNIPPRSNAANTKGGAPSGDRIACGTMTLQSWEEVGPDNIVRPKEREVPVIHKALAARHTVNGIVLLKEEKLADLDRR